MNNEAFGILLGITPPNINVYSCNYGENLQVGEIPNLDTYNHVIDGIYYGIKWQCVELARRWLIKSYNITFEDVNIAREIYDLQYLINQKDSSKIPWISITNGSTIKPNIGSLLIWEKEYNYGSTGHVAIIIDIGDSWIRIIEQNVDNTIWPGGQNWSRQLVMDVTKIQDVSTKDDDLNGFNTIIHNLTFTIIFSS